MFLLCAAKCDRAIKGYWGKVQLYRVKGLMKYLYIITKVKCESKLEGISR